MNSITNLPKDVSFKNCCILKMSLTVENDIGTVELIYEGTVIDKQHPHYFTHINTNDTDILFKPFKFNVTRLNINPSNIDGYYNIFLIRHGEATHNLKNTFHNPKDKDINTLLTSFPNRDDGQKQATRAGAFLANYLKGQKISYTFCSDLIRTRQTLAIISSKLDTNNRLIILPCSDEIESCKTTLQSQLHNPNKFQHHDRHLYQSQNQSLRKMFDGYDIDWSYYNGFKGTCSDSNMIQIAFDIINPKQHKHPKHLDISIVVPNEAIINHNPKHSKQPEQSEPSEPSKPNKPNKHVKYSDRSIIVPKEAIIQSRSKSEFNKADSTENFYVDSNGISMTYCDVLIIIVILIVLYVCYK